jgi:uncharacterized protein YbbC (DUF1343 family)/CubicO group peptidase (beta-lactamase class C family)
VIAAILLAASAATAAATAARPAPPAVSAERLARIDDVVRSSIAAGELPGAVVLVQRGGRVVYRKAIGDRALLPAREPATLDTIYDVASLTKVVATAPSVMILVEEGKVRLGDPVVRYLPEFGAGGGDRAKVTVEQLLLHRAGLPPDDPLELYTGTPEEIFARKYARPLAGVPGEKFVYSDVGYEVLGELVRKVTGETLDRFAEERIFKPLGMRDTFFRPSPPLPAGEGRGEGRRIAPTEQREGRWMRGEVHDPRAYALGGVAGHAGLFSTADDLARFCRMLLGGGSLGGVRVLSPLGVDALTRPRFLGDGDVRALGFDLATAYARNRGELFPEGSFGHTGWTGTSIWIDPASKAFVVFLSNRVHPDGKGDVLRLRGIVATIAAAALTDTGAAADELRSSARSLSGRVAHPAREVRAGIDVLAAHGFREIAGMRVGLLANATSIARDGRTTAAVLTSPEAKGDGVTLVRLFSPEHGPRTDADAAVPDQTDPATNLPVVSLFGERRRPTSADLDGIDAVVYDLQDVGTRFYTYPSTGGYLLEACAARKIPFVVLDRPDPIGGRVEGPLPDSDRLSFTAYHSVPVRYGLTPGELFRLVAHERHLAADVRVVEMVGWRPDLWYDDTGLAWVNPSPNMRSLTAAMLYPGVGLLEATNVSVGRGTDTPFELVGAPWMNGRRVAAYLAARKIPGVRFTPVQFTPSASVFAGERCGGVRIDVVDRERLSPVALGIELAVALRALHAADWDRTGLVALLANADLAARIDRGDTADSIVASWARSVADFEKRRASFRLYEDVP